MKKINAAETEFAKVCLKKDGHVNMHARERVFVNDSRNGNEFRIHAFVVSGSKKWTRITDNRDLIRRLLDSIGCRFTEGNDAPRRGTTALQSGFNDYFPKEDCVVIFPDEFTGE